MALMPPANGLRAIWSLYGITAFVNPPYGRRITGLWIEKCVEAAKLGMAVVALVPSRTDTIWWHELVRPTAQAICSWKGRIHFIGAKHGAPFPSALIYWGYESQRFKSAFQSKGAVEILRRAPRHGNNLRQGKLPIAA